ncbi:MAG: sigma-70 family RNA polymerase sigma factor [Bacteroidota bacterium]|nr:sigma-70 family RNA polymerase sigma factor [Bacteroidota bacterium]
MAYQDDSFYINRVLNHGDAAAFAGLVNKHKTLAFNIALRITRNREDAEEVAQDAFVKLYHALGDFKGDSKFTTWFFRVVYNQALAKIRKKSLFTGSVDDEGFREYADENAFDGLKKFKEKEKKLYLSEAISALDEADQLLITLYYMDDQPVDAIAGITGLTESNVKVRLFRARKKIHDQLQTTLKEELHAIL